MIAKSSCVFLMCAMFVLGYGIAKEDNNEQEKEVIELSIELTELQIKKLKGVCNG